MSTIPFPIPSPPPVPYTAASLSVLAAAITNGVTRVRFQDRDVQYNSISDMQLSYTMIYNALYPGAGGAGPRRQYRLRSCKGL